MPETLQQELVNFLSDMYSVEQQALAQMVSAPKIAGDATIAEHFRVHHGETKEQAKLVGDRLKAQGGSPSRVKDAVMKLGGKSFLLFARVQPETPGRLVAHAYAYEAMEWAGYDLLTRLAERAGDAEAAETAKGIRDEERIMMHRLEASFDAAEQASHGGTDAKQLPRQVCKHLGEAHALEKQGEQLLKKSDDIGGDERLEQLYHRHVKKTREHQRLIEARLDALDGNTSAFKDTAMKIGGAAWGLFFQAQSDTPAKLAAFVYAFEHLKIAGYELLRRVAKRAGDGETQQLCDQILANERAMVQQLSESFDVAVQSTVETLGV